MHPFKLALAASTAMVGSYSASFATVLHQTASFSGKTDWGTTTTTPSFTPNKTLGFTGFNPSLGTLTNISVTITESVNGTVDLRNNNPSTTTTVSANLSNTLKYFFPVPNTVHSLVVPSSSYSQSLGPLASSGTQPVAGSGATTRIVPSADFSTYETAWDITVGDLGQVTVGSGNGNGSATYTDTGGVVITVDYTYTPASPPPPPPPPPPVTTPEPGTLTILGAGLAGLGLLRRRRKSS